MSKLSVVEKYTQPEVLAFWQQLSLSGLQGCEREMLTRYTPETGRVLDLGCGSGRVGLALTPLGYQVTGLDITWEMVRSARQLYQEKGIESDLIQADMLTLPLQPASYDIALIFIAALQHFPKQKLRRRVLQEISRVLRPTGVLILALDNLAPALTCYAWWTWRKMRSFLKPKKSSVIPKPTTDDAAKEVINANRQQMNSLTWHLRGLKRTFRWRTIPGWIDRGRRWDVLPGEIGDLMIDQVSLNPTPGKVDYHIYRHEELLADAAAAGLTLLGYHAAAELEQGQTFTPRVRQLDKQVLYAFSLA